MATEFLYNDERVGRIIERHCEISEMYREQEFGQKLEKAAIARMKGDEDVMIEGQDWV